MDRCALRSTGKASAHRASLGAVLAWLLAAGCGGGAGERSPERVEALGSGVLARVNGQTVSSTFVREVAKRHDLDLRVARDRVVVDALFASEARERLAGSGFVEVIEKNALADAVLAELRARAEKAGPATVAELDELRREQWERFDRPVSVATLHAVVLAKESGDDAAARDLAQKIHDATEGLGKPEEFAKVARGVAAGGLDKRVESLPHVTPDGRTVQFDPAVPLPTKELDPVFASAANAIAKEGEVSAVVKTSFGYHVIFLVERIDAQRYSDEELRNRFGNLVVQERAKRELASLMDSLQKRAAVDRARNFDRLTAEVWGQH